MRRSYLDSPATDEESWEWTSLILVGLAANGPSDPLLLSGFWSYLVEAPPGAKVKCRLPAGRSDLVHEWPTGWVHKLHLATGAGDW